MAQQYDLQLNLKKGQHYTQSMVMDMVTTQSIAGQEMSVKYKIKTDILQTVKSIKPDGNLSIESEYTHMAIQANAMGTDMAFDSDVKDTSGDPISQKYAGALSSIVGKKFDLVISPKGKVIEIKGIKELLQAVKKSTKDPVAQKLFESNFDESQIKSNFETAYQLFPDHPVQAGDVWTRTTSVESLVPIYFSTTYTLSEVKNGIAKIVVKGDISIKKDDYEVSGMTMKINLTGSYDGIYTMDINTGVTNTGNINKPLKGTMEVMGMEVPASIISTTQITSSPVN